MSVSSYISLKKSKTGIKVPIYSNGTPSCSLYNPENEAELFINLPEFSNSNYFVIGGYASGLHIKKLRHKYKNAFICILENNQETINFCKKNSLLDFIFNDKHSIICNIDSLEETLINTYFPPIHGNFTFKALRSWENFHSDKSTKIKTSIDMALKKISTDISVQAHFGKIWHRNILLNLKLSSFPDLQSINFEKTIFPIYKKAIVCGAGPGLNYSINELFINREKYYIVATDTSYQVLLQQHIISDVVVTTDAQNVSLYHFAAGISNKTLLVSDLSASPSVARLAYTNKCNILFYNGGHPLSNYATNYELQKNVTQTNINKRYPYFSAGSGSVTLVCLDFIFKCGFKDYEVIGADFSYVSNKTYTNGTYLDMLYAKKSYKLNSLEQQYDTLMFRTPLEVETVYVKTLSGQIKKNGKITETLKNYRKSYHNFIAKKSTNKKSLNYKKCKKFIPFFTNSSFNFISFKTSLYHSLQIANKNDTLEIPPILYPYIAYYAKSYNTIDFKEKITDILIRTKILCEENK